MGKPTDVNFNLRADLSSQRQCRGPFTDATALHETALDRRPEVDSAVQPGDGRFRSGLVEGREASGRQPTPIVGVVHERDNPELRGKDRSCGGRLHRVAGGVLREGRRDQWQRVAPGDRALAPVA
jgi:hypothetical protein